MSQTYFLDTMEGKLHQAGQLEDKSEKSLSQVFLMSPEEFKALKGDYPHKQNLCRSMCPIQYCKLETFSECIQGTMRVPRESGGRINMQVFGFYLQKDLLIFIEEGSLLEMLLSKICCGAYGTCTLHQFLLILFEALIEDDILYLQQQEEMLSAIEEKLLKKIPEHFNETVLRYRKHFSVYHSYYEQLINIGDQMQGEFGLPLTPEERSCWQLYSGRAGRLHDHVELLREYLVQLRDLYQSLIDVEQNKVMGILTVVTTIFLPLTLIAGWYGMNFPNMPEFHWDYSYAAVIAASIFIILVEILYFRKKKML